MDDSSRSKKILKKIQVALREDQLNPICIDARASFPFMKIRKSNLSIFPDFLRMESLDRASTHIGLSQFSRVPTQKFFNFFLNGSDYP